MSWNPRAGLIAAVLLCAPAVSTAAGPEAPVTSEPWQEAVISVTDLDVTARFFLEIGQYEIKWRGPVDASEIAAWGLPATASGEAMLLGPAGYRSGLVRLVRFDEAGRKSPTRPGSRAWDTGCYFSLMVRMQDLHSIYDDAIRMLMQRCLLDDLVKKPARFELPSDRVRVMVYTEAPRDFVMDISSEVKHTGRILFTKDVFLNGGPAGSQ